MMPGDDRFPQPPRGLGNRVRRGNTDRVKTFLPRKILDQGAQSRGRQKSRAA
jgi:hypothetical protein